VTEIESAWDRYPEYQIDILPCPATARAWVGDLLLAESDSCLRVAETKHVDRLYFPEGDVRWELFEPTDLHTICPFKGEADYWTLTASDPPENDVVWTYRKPFAEVAGIEGFVCFYQERVRIVLEEHWSGDDDPRAAVTTSFPAWGDAEDLLRLMDVEPVGSNRFVAPDFRAPAYRETMVRDVVEGGQMLGQGLVAASKSVPDQRVTSGYMIFSKSATFYKPLDVTVDVLRAGRTYSTVEARINQEDALCSVGLFLFDSGAADVIQGSAEMPSVPGPFEATPLDMGVTGRDLRIVDNAYAADPDRVGIPEIYAWCRFAEAPKEQYLHAALMVQSMTHWTIAAAMRPHAGITEEAAHDTLSTGIMSIAVAFHEPVDVTDWLLYANPAIYAGHGQAQGEGRVYTEDGRLVSSYTVQAMIRDFTRPPEAMGMDSSTVM
jgi:acyl-CoA thioesterase-2